MNRYLGALVAFGLFTGYSWRAGASSTPQPVTSHAAVRQHNGPNPALSSYRSLYSFKGLPDGAMPSAGLIAVNGALYGTTREGGQCLPFTGSGGSGFGTVFAISPFGTERVLYRFKGGADGSYPFGSLIDVNGTLYGITSYGGMGGNGTVFAVSTSGKERVLYRFRGGSDGGNPPAGLIAVNGLLYGTTSGGGTRNHGTVFEISMSGKERVLYSFNGGTDGALPLGSLIAVNGALYGTTTLGGMHNDGTIFALSLPGARRF